MAEPVHLGLTVNGVGHEVEVPAEVTLLDLLRERIGLTGTKECCAEGECGACTVILDGRSVNSCLVLAAEVDGSTVTTVEGLATDDRLSAVQAAFLDAGAVQCGFCIPGMVVSAHDLLGRIALPSRDEIREGLSGNLCRCGGYNQICDAVAHAAAQRTGAGQ